MTTFSFKIICTRKIMFEFLTFKIQNFQMTSDRVMTKIKVVNLLELYNFVVDNFFIWIHLESQILILKLDNVNTRGMLCPLVTNDFEVELLALICMKPEIAGSNPHCCSRVVVVTVHELYPVLAYILLSKRNH